jgi:hypothetical protein
MRETDWFMNILKGAIIDTSTLHLRNLRYRIIIYDRPDYIDDHYTGGCIRNGRDHYAYDSIWKQEILIVHYYKATVYLCIIHVNKVQYSVNFSCPTSPPMGKLLLLLSQFDKQHTLHCFTIDCN